MWLLLQKMHSESSQVCKIWQLKCKVHNAVILSEHTDPGMMENQVTSVHHVFHQYNVIIVMKAENIQMITANIRFRKMVWSFDKRTELWHDYGGLENPCYDIVFMAELPLSFMSAIQEPCLDLGQTGKMNQTNELCCPCHISVLNVPNWHWTKKGQIGENFTLKRHREHLMPPSQDDSW